MADPIPGLADCRICGKHCIPLADYDTPVCFRCDDEFEQIRRRSTLDPLDTADLAAQFARHRLPDVEGCGTPAGYLAHFAAGEEPCWPCFHFWQIAQANRHAWAIRPDPERSHVA